MRLLLIIALFLSTTCDAQFAPFMSNKLPTIGWGFYPGNCSTTGVNIGGGGTRLTFTNAVDNVCVATNNGTGGVSTGTVYWEALVTNGGGIISAGVISGLTVGNYNDHLGKDANGFAYYSTTGGWWAQAAVSPTFSSCGTANWSVTNNVIGFALDAGANTLAIYLNNVLQCTKTVSGGSYYPACSSIQSNILTWHFTTASFTYTPPGGFVAL